MRWVLSVAVAAAALGGAAGCASTNADARTALLVTANAVGKAKCGGPIARRASTEVLERTGDDRYGGGRARVTGSAGDGTTCEGEVLFAYARRDTEAGLFTGQLAVLHAIVVEPNAKPPAPTGTPLALGAPRRGTIASAEGEAFRVDLEQGRAVTLLARGPKPLVVELAFGAQALELPNVPGIAPFFVPPATGSYALRVRGPEGASFVVAVLPGGLAGAPDGAAPESRP